MKKIDNYKIGSIVSIFKREKSPYWYCSYNQNGKERIQSLKTEDKKTAMFEALDFESQLLSGASPNENKIIPLDEAVNNYIDYLESENRSQSTLKRYRPEFNRFVNFCNKQKIKVVDKLTPIILDQYRALRKGQIHEKTRYHESCTIKSFGKYLHKRGYVTENPFVNCEFKKPRSTERPFFTEKQLEEILLASGDKERQIYTVLAFTGLRVAELRYLTWHDVNWKKGMIIVQPKKDWDTKNHKSRSVPIHPRVLAVLKQRPQSYKWVFTAGKSQKYPVGGGQFSPRHLLEKLKRTLKRLNMDTSLTVHSFRHFFCSHCANRGTPERQLMAWLGHSSSEMTQKYYHNDDEVSKDAMARLVAFTSQSKAHKNLG